MGRLIREVECALEKYRSRNKNVLELNFINVKFTQLDTEELDSRIFGAFLSSPTPPIHLSFPCCEMDDERATEALEKFASSHPIESLNFSVTDFDQFEIERIVTAARKTVKKLHFTITYKRGIPLGIIDVYSNIDSDFIVMENYPLESLHLDAKSLMQKRLRLPRMQELSAALPRLRNLKTFELSHCELDDEAMGILVAGVITLRDSLQAIQIHIDRANFSPFALACFSFLMADMECLAYLDLDIQNSKRSLFDNAADIQLDRFLEALQGCRAKLRFRITNCGLNSKCTALMINVLRKRSESQEVQLRLKDSNFIRDEHVPLALQHALPNMPSVSELSIVDTGEECTSMDPSKQLKIVEQLERNFKIQYFDLQFGTNIFDESNRARLDRVLRRNRCLKHFQEALDSEQDPFSPLWPVAIKRIQRESGGFDPSSTYFALNHLLCKWPTQHESRPQLSLEDSPRGVSEAFLSATQGFSLVTKRRASEVSESRRGGLKRSISTESWYLRQQRIHDALYYLDDSVVESDCDSSISSYSSSSSREESPGSTVEHEMDHGISADKHVAVDSLANHANITSNKEDASQKRSIISSSEFSANEDSGFASSESMKEAFPSTPGPTIALDQDLDSWNDKENKTSSSNFGSPNTPCISSQNRSPELDVKAKKKKKSRKNKKESRRTSEGDSKERKIKKKDAKKRSKKDSSKPKKERQGKKSASKSVKKIKKASRSLGLLETVVEETFEELIDNEAEKKALRAGLNPIADTAKLSKSKKKPNKDKKTRSHRHHGRRQRVECEP